MNKVYRIGDYLLQHARENKDLSLMEGKMGISIFCFIFSRISNDNKYSEFAELLLDDIYKEISVNHTSDFYHGLAGIGWGIEYLVQNKYIEADTDEVLEIVDISTLKALTTNASLHFGLNGYLGYLLYLTQRLKNSKNLSSVPYKINKELLIYVINKIDEVCHNHFSQIGTDTSFDLTLDFPVLMIVLERVSQLNLYNVKLERMVNQFSPYFETKMPAMNINKLYLASAVNKLLLRVPNLRLEKQVQKLLFSIDYNEIKDEVDENNYTIRYGTWGVKYILWQFLVSMPQNDLNWKTIVQLYNSFSYAQDILPETQEGATNQTSLKELGLLGGIAGIGFSNLFLPSVIDDLSYNSMKQPLNLLFNN